MSNKTIQPSKQDIKQINEDIKKVTDKFVIFHNFQNIEIEATLSLGEMCKIKEVILNAEALLAIKE